MAFPHWRAPLISGLLLASLPSASALAQTVACSGVGAWSATTTYTAGAKVVYKGSLYTALVSTTNVQPDYCASCGWWKLEGVCGTTQATCTSAPAVPSGLATSAITSSSLNITWSAVAAPANCSVSYKVFQNGVQIATPSTNSLSITGLAANTGYSFTVASVDAAGTSAQSAAVSATTLTAGNTGGGTSCNGISAYVPGNVYVGGNQVVYSGKIYKAKWWTQNETPSTGGSGVWEYVSDCTTVACTGAPSVPSGLGSSNVTATGANLSWNAASAGTGCTVSYKIFQNGAQIATSTSPTLTVSGLSANTTYTFTVASVDQAGTSAQSAGLSVKTPVAAVCGAAPSVPTGLASPAQGTSSVNLSWAAASAGTNCSITYNVYQNGTKILTVPTTSAVVSGLAADTAYTFTVASVDAAGTSAQSGSISARTAKASTVTGNLTQGEVSNPNGRYFAGYYPTWSDNWFSAVGWDGNKKTDDQIYTDSYLAKVPGVYTHVKLSFAQPNFSWNGMSANNWSGTGLSFNATPADIKEVVRLLHILKKKVIIAVGGATYNSWGPLSSEAGVNGPTKAALTKFMQDMDIDGLDVDYELPGADAASVLAYANAIQAMREACDAAGSGKLLTMAAWSTGADYTPATGSGPLGLSFWGGDAGRERQTFSRKGTGSYAGRTIGSLLDVCDIMSYDAQTFHYDPITAFDQYRAMLPANIPVSIGLEIPPEGWAGGMLVLNNSESGATGTFVEADQYGRTNRGAYSVEHFGNYVKNNTVNANPHDGLMLWQILKTSSPTSANATTVGAKVATMFGYVATKP